MNVHFDFPLKQYNTFGMEVRCTRFITVDTDSDLQVLFEEHVFEEPHYILGGGSNTLFTQNYEGTIIHPNTKGFEVLEDCTNHLLLRVAAGEEWSALMDYCRRQHLYGLENLIGIPGLVGSAPVQNIGAYGVEVKECIERVEGFYTHSMQPFSLSAEQCRFGYRDSLFKNELKGCFFITHVCFNLSKTARFNLSYKALADALESKTTTLEGVMDTVKFIRDSKLPDISKIGCAGSFFKNPIVSQSDYENLLKKIPDLISFPAGTGFVKLAAGQLIEKAGWKGRRIGNAGVFETQALVVVNFGGATPEEVSTVYQRVISDVWRMFGVRLSPEVNIIP